MNLDRHFPRPAGRLSSAFVLAVVLLLALSGCATPAREEQIFAERIELVKLDCEDLPESVRELCLELVERRASNYYRFAAVAVGELDTAQT